MIIDRIRSTEYPGKREFRLFFVLREKGRYSSLKTLTFCFMIAAAGRGKQKTYGSISLQRCRNKKKEDFS